jgi:hypothetical protein
VSSRADFTLAGEDPQHYGLVSSLGYIWDVPTLSWVKSTGGGSGGGGAVTIADGADVAQGTTTDAAWVSGAGTVISLLKKIASPGGGGLTDTELRASPVPVSGTFFQATQPVSGTFWQATQPVSGPLTDAQLRAVAVPVSGTVTASGPLTDAQLRATAVPVSLTATTLTATVTPAGDDVVADGRDVVTTAGTRVQMQAQACKAVAVTAETDNTGVIVVGSVTCVAALATRRGLPLSAGDTAIFAVDNVNRLYLDSTVSGDGVTWAVLG